VFLPCVLLLYYLVPKQLKNAVLLLSSLVFYAWGEPKYVIIMIISVALGYVFGLLMEKFRKTPWCKVFMIISVIISASFLVYFKYADFFVSNFNAVTGLSVPLLRVTLPIGISFYTFQLISYTVDVYRGVPAQKNPADLAAYIAMFPQLIAGPIVRYVDIAEQLKNRTHTLSASAYGIRRFVIGLAKKILIANALGELCDIFRASDDKSVLFYWLYAIAYMLHIYFDFSGYSDMAVGLGKLLGFNFIENFNYPYISRSVTEFWRRWHMSLGTWFRDYVYIPLGGNRVKPLRHIFNILVVWMFTGFWHGAAWTFIIWGLYFAVLLTAEKFFLGKILKKSKILSHVYLLFFVMISFIIFNAADMKQAFADMGGLFGAGGIPFASAEALYYLRSYAVLLIAGIIGATPLVAKAASYLSGESKKEGETLSGKRAVLANITAVAEPVVLIVLLAVMTAFLVDGSFNPFLYFRF